MADKKLYVQAGKSVTSIKGMLSEGAEVSEKMFKGGEKSIAGLIAKKVIGAEKPDIRTKAELVKEREEEKLAKKNKAAKVASDKAEADAKAKAEADAKAKAEADAKAKAEADAKAKAEKEKNK